MSDKRQVAISSDDFVQAREKVIDAAVWQMTSTMLLIGVVVFVATFTSVALIGSDNSFVQAGVATALVMGLIIPVSFWIYHSAVRETRATNELAVAWEQRIESEVARRNFETQLSETRSWSSRGPSRQ
jgi:hypothetical protein